MRRLLHPGRTSSRGGVGLFGVFLCGWAAVICCGLVLAAGLLPAAGALTAADRDATLGRMTGQWADRML